MGMAQWRALACLACRSPQVSFPGLKGEKRQQRRECVCKDSEETFLKRSMKMSNKHTKRFLVPGVLSKSESQ